MNKVKDILFIRNMSLTVAIYFSIVFITMLIVLNTAQNECEKLDNINQYECRNIIIVPNNIDSWILTIGLLLVFSGMITMVIMTFAWKDFNDIFPIFKNISDLEINK